MLEWNESKAAECIHTQCGEDNIYFVFDKRIEMHLLQNLRESIKCNAWFKVVQCFSRALSEDDFLWNCVSHSVSFCYKETLLLLLVKWYRDTQWGRQNWIVSKYNTSRVIVSIVFYIYVFNIVLFCFYPTSNYTDGHGHRDMDSHPTYKCVTLRDDQSNNGRQHKKSVCCGL